MKVARLAGDAPSAVRRVAWAYALGILSTLAGGAYLLILPGIAFGLGSMPSATDDLRLPLEMALVFLVLPAALGVWSVRGGVAARRVARQEQLGEPADGRARRALVLAWVGVGLGATPWGCIGIYALVHGIGWFSFA